MRNTTKKGRKHEEIKKYFIKSNTAKTINQILYFLVNFMRHFLYFQSTFYPPDPHLDPDPYLDSPYKGRCGSRTAWQTLCFHKTGSILKIINNIMFLHFCVSCPPPYCAPRTDIEFFVWIWILTGLQYKHETSAYALAVSPFKQILYFLKVVNWAAGAPGRWLTQQLLSRPLAAIRSADMWECFVIILLNCL